jgi:hypothetical protein
MIDVEFYFGEIGSYFNDLSNEERTIYLCAFILFLIYIIVARARRKYNPGSLSRQFAGAIVLLGVVLIGGGFLIETGGGSYSGIFRI